jgi:hypothetical protein
VVCSQNEQTPFTATGKNAAIATAKFIQPADTKDIFSTLDIVQRMYTMAHPLLQ